MRPPERGLGRRSPGGVAGVGAVLGMFAMTGALILAVVAVRSLTPDAYDEIASLVVTSLAACAAAGVWWIGIDRNADVFEQNRERMIDALAKSADT
jgi:cytochrome bd-type quinol oxidase subunit 2